MSVHDCAVYGVKDSCCSNEMSKTLHQSRLVIHQSEQSLFKKIVSRLGSRLFPLMYSLHKQQATTSLWIMETVCLALSVYWKGNFIDSFFFFFLPLSLTCSAWGKFGFCLEHNMESNGNVQLFGYLLIVVISWINEVSPTLSFIQKN